MSSESSFEWKELYDLANFLIDNYEDEATFRTAISRYYYSSFCSVRDYLIENNLFRGKRSKNIMKGESSQVHEETRDILNDPKVITNIHVGRKISRKLNELRLKRNEADYEKHKSANLNSCKYCKARAKTVFENLEKL